MQITIVGAGIGGLTAAATLIRRGHTVKIYEQAAQLTEVGAGVQLSANATKVLRELGLEPEFERLGVKPNAFEFRRFDTGELLHRIPLGDTHRQRHGASYYQMHRVELHSILVDVVRRLDPHAIELNSRVTSVSQDENSTQVSFANRPPVTSELLVGADGIKSVVRRHILGEDEPEFTGQVAWRIAIPTERIPKDLRPDVVSTIWCGPNNHAVMYYISGGALLNFVGCVERPWEEESWTAKRPWSDLDQDYAGWHPVVRAAIEVADKNECYRWALNNRKPETKWSRGRVVLLGDAIHATLPYMAQGAVMAIEDAEVLSRLLSSDLPLGPALKAYETHRAPRTARIVYESTEMASLYHITDADEMRRAFAARNIAASRNEWLYPYDPLTVELPSS